MLVPVYLIYMVMADADFLKLAYYRHGLTKKRAPLVLFLIDQVKFLPEFHI